jgi:hypothetical protein
MDEVQSPESGLIGLVRRLVDGLTAAKAYLAVLRRRLRRGDVAPAEVEAHLARGVGEPGAGRAAARRRRGGDRGDETRSGVDRVR